jgi:hypothetical protein
MSSKTSVLNMILDKIYLHSLGILFSYMQNSKILEIINVWNLSTQHDEKFKEIMFIY